MLREGLLFEKRPVSSLPYVGSAAAGELPVHFYALLAKML
jgi:hypothetical protein